METKISSVFESYKVVVLKNTTVSANKIFEKGIILDYEKGKILINEHKTIEVVGDDTCSFNGIHTNINEICCDEDFIDYRAFPITNFEFTNVSSLTNLLEGEDAPYTCYLDNKYKYLKCEDSYEYDIFFSNSKDCYTIIAEVNASHIDYNYCVVNSFSNEFTWVPREFIKFDNNYLDNRITTAIETLKAF